MYGTVTRGPTSPVCRKGIPCSEPARDVKLVFRHGDQIAASVITAKDGRYAVSLAPGAYLVAVDPQLTIGSGIDPSTVRVVAGSRRNVDFQIDTGIR